jgi:hypothetical protein
VQLTDEAVSWPTSHEEPLHEVAVVALLLDSTGVNEEATRLRRVDITNALDRGTTLIVFIGPDGQAGAQTPLGSWLLSELTSVPGIPVSWGGPYNVRSERTQFEPFFRDKMAHAHFLTVPDDVEVLARLRPGQPDSPAASLRFQLGKATVFLVPLRTVHGSEDEAHRFITLAPSDDDYPEYLDALDLGGEADARSGLRELQQEQARLEAHLTSARRAKRILYFKAMALQEEVVRHLNEELGVPTRLIGGNKEDFHLLSETDDPWCIGEVKGRDTIDVRKSDVNQLTINRSEAGFPDDFPSLLVVSTYRQRQTVVARDESVHPDVIRRAAEDHVVVVRTLDLVRVKQALRADNRIPLEGLLSAISSGGGWFEVSDSGDHALRTP